MKGSNKSKADIADKAERLSDRELLKRFIKSQFSPDVESSLVSMSYTSRDIQWRYRDMCTVSVSTVAEVMQELKFEIEFINGMPYWRMFEKHPE